MIRIVIPDDVPPVLPPSAVWPSLTGDNITYYDTMPGTEERLIERISCADAVLNIRSSTRFTGRVFSACPKMRILSLWGTGTDHVDLSAAKRFGVTVCNTPGVAAVSIAEHTLALLLAVTRQLPQIDSATRAGTWSRGHFMELAGKTCGIVGLGAIGREFARLARAIGMRTIAWTMHPRSIDGVEAVALDELYRTSDVISLHLRLSPETTGFVGRNEFAKMKPGAILLNTARGAIVDEADMIDALQSGRIAGAGLDVFTTEPLPPGHPITKLANVVLTPHCAGITPEAMEAGLRMSVENIWAFFDGRPQNVVR